MILPSSRRAGGVLLLLAMSIAAAGCGTSGRAPAARSAALAFERGLRDGDANALCALISPEVRDELESSEKASCVEVIGKQDIPAAGALRSVDVYGRQARVQFKSDTLFLSSFPKGWRVVAAGCQEQPGKPYQCAIKAA